MKLVVYNKMNALPLGQKSKERTIRFNWKSHSTLPLLATQNYPFWLKYD